jgi:hypothetical protein
VLDERANKSAHRPRPRRRAVFIALGLLAVALAELIIAVAVAPLPPWLHVLLLETWPLVAMAAGLLFAYEAFLHHRFVHEIARISGPSIVENLLPQDVMHTFLASIYGDNDANRDVVSGVLGGEGLRPQGGDLTISTHTTVDYELSAIDPETYHLTSTVSYSFKKGVAVDRFVIFATCNALLRDSISSGCRLPLFELWFVPDPELFQDSVDDMLPSVNIGISYVDDQNRRRTAEFGRIRPTDVKFDRWSEYLTFFRESMGPMPRQNPRQHLNDLRIFECDLSVIASDHGVKSIERLTLRSTTLQRVDDGYCYWQSPYPCYVDRIKMDAKDLAADGVSLEFRIVPFTFRSNTTSARWLPAHELGDLDVQSWLLPGHGVALLWRSGA